MRLVYFSWIREKIGKESEEIVLDASIAGVADLIKFLENLGNNYQSAFSQRELVYVALDKKLVSHNTLLADSKEIAFFPPMTGG